MDARTIVSRFSILVAKSPAFIYSTALPLTISTNSVSRQFDTLRMSPIKLDKSRVDFDIDETSSIPETVIHPFPSIFDFSSVVFSADLRYIISHSSSGFTQIWNTHTGEEITGLSIQSAGMFLSRHAAYVYCIAFSPGGDIIAARSEYDAVRLWKTENGAPIGEPLEGYTKAATCAAFSPDGKTIALGSADGVVRLWSTETGWAIGEPFTRHKDYVVWVTWSHDGKILASGSKGGEIVIWDIESGIPELVLYQRYYTTTSLAFSPNGKWFAAVLDSRAQVWNITTGEKEGEPYEGLVSSVSFSPDGTRIILGLLDGAVKVSSVETREEVMPPLKHGNFVKTVAYSQDGSRILSVSSRGITLWNSLTGRPIIGTDRTFNNFESIAEDGSNLDLNDCQLLKGWKVDDGWLVGASGEYRLFLPRHIRKLVCQVDEGVYVHQDLHLNLCNAAAKDFKGFILSSS